LPDSHVLETISGRGTLHQILMRDESLRRLDALISEIQRNKSVLKDIMETCKENIEKRKEAHAKGKKLPVNYTTSRFSAAAVELLVTSRYIDADETLYKMAEEYMDWLTIVNDRLSAWPNRPEPVEQWLSEVRETVKSLIGQFKKLVMKNIKAIEKIS